MQVYSRRDGTIIIRAENFSGQLQILIRKDDTVHISASRELKREVRKALRRPHDRRWDKGSLRWEDISLKELFGLLSRIGY